MLCAARAIGCSGQGLTFGSDIDFPLDHERACQSACCGPKDVTNVVSHPGRTVSPGSPHTHVRGSRGTLRGQAADDDDGRGGGLAQLLQPAIVGARQPAQDQIVGLLRSGEDGPRFVWSSSAIDGLAEIAEDVLKNREDRRIVINGQGAPPSGTYLSCRITETATGSLRTVVRLVCLV